MSPDAMRLQVLRHGEALPGMACALVDAGITEGHRFLDQIQEYWERPWSHYADPRAFMLLAWQGAETVGIAGVTVDPYAGDPLTGRLKHVYVIPGARRRGVAEALVCSALAEAQGRWRRLRLRTADPAAARLYERLGFRSSPGEPDSTHVHDLTPACGPLPQPGAGPPHP